MANSQVVLDNKKIVIATHVYTTGPAQDLRDFLIEKKVDRLLFIGHPLFFDQKLLGSGFEIYTKGKIIAEKYEKIKKIPELLSYLKHCILDICWGIKFAKDTDLYVGSDNLNALAGLALRWLGVVKKVVYYVIDYNPYRFKNGLTNKIYHKIDQFCVKYSDETWNLNDRMRKARRDYFHFSAGNQIETPIGIWFNRIKRLDFSQIEKHTLVYMGHVTKKQGIQYVLEAIPTIIEEIPNFQFLVIGGGPYLEELQAKTQSLKIDRFVRFAGYIERHEDVEKLLTRCGLAIAIYEKFDEEGHLSFTYFSDPGKIKSYMACGLPVLLTDVPHNASLIKEKRCGKIVDQNKNGIAQMVISLMKDEKTLQEFRKNAISYAKKYDWDLIFSKNLERILNA